MIQEIRPCKPVASAWLLFDVGLDFSARCAIFHDKQDSGSAFPVFGSQALEVDGEVFEVHRYKAHCPHRLLAAPMIWYLDVVILPGTAGLQIRHAVYIQQ